MDIDGNGFDNYSKADREAALVDRCRTAVERGDFTDVSRDDFARALLALGNAHAQQTGRDFRLAYLEVLHSDLGSRLFTGLRAIERDLPPEAA